MKHSALHTILTGSTDTTVSGLRGSAPQWLAAEIAENSPLLCILPDEHLVACFAQDLSLFTNKKVAIYPGQEIPPYTPLSADQRITAERLASLSLMREGHAQIMVSSIEAILRRTMPKDVLTANSEYIVAGEECDRDDLLNGLTKIGYEQVALVQSVGDYAVRGSVIDIFPPSFRTTEGNQHEGPIRLDFFGDMVESVRSFNPINQRSSEELEEVILLPVADILLHSIPDSQCRELVRTIHEMGEKYNWNPEEVSRIAERLTTRRSFAGIEFFLPLFSPKNVEPTSTVFDFLPTGTNLLLVDSAGIRQAMALTLERIDQNLISAKETGFPALPPEMLFLDETEFDERLATFRTVLLNDLVGPDQEVVKISSNSHQLLQQEISLRRTRQGLLAPLAEQLQAWLQQNEQPIICCRSPRHTKNLA